MRPKRIVTPTLTAEQAARLRQLIAAVPSGADESDPAFGALLGFWGGVTVPYGALPTVRAYCALDGSWLCAGVDEVLDDLRAVLRSRGTPM